MSISPQIIRGISLLALTDLEDFNNTYEPLENLYILTIGISPWRTCRLQQYISALRELEDFNNTIIENWLRLL